MQNFILKIVYNSGLIFCQKSFILFKSINLAHFSLNSPTMVNLTVSRQVSMLYGIRFKKLGHISQKPLKLNALYASLGHGLQYRAFTKGQFQIKERFSL